MVGALSCISRNTMAFLALSLIREAQSVSVVSRGYRASLHSPVGLEVQTQTCRTHTGTNFLIHPLKCVCVCVLLLQCLMFISLGIIALTWRGFLYFWAAVCE